MWTLYDFRENWALFLEIWNIEHIQIKLQIYIRNFCFENNLNLCTDPLLPLWQYSTTNYWEHKITIQAHKKIYHNNLIQSFKKSMQQHLKIIPSRRLFYETCFTAIKEDFVPKPNSIESFIMDGGQNVLSFIFLHVARILFPNDSDIVFTQDENGIDMILLPNKKIIFDIYLFYDDKPLYNDSYYDALCSEFIESVVEEDIDW